MSLKKQTFQGQLFQFRFSRPKLKNGAVVFLRPKRYFSLALKFGAAVYPAGAREVSDAQMVIDDGKWSVMIGNDGSQRLIN